MGKNLLPGGPTAPGKAALIAKPKNPGSNDMDARIRARTKTMQNVPPTKASPPTGVAKQPKGPMGLGGRRAFEKDIASELK